MAVGLIEGFLVGITEGVGVVGLAVGIAVGFIEGFTVGVIEGDVDA